MYSLFFLFSIYGKDYVMECLFSVSVSQYNMVLDMYMCACVCLLCIHNVLWLFCIKI